MNTNDMKFTGLTQGLAKERRADHHNTIGYDIPADAYVFGDEVDEVTGTKVSMTLFTNKRIFVFQEETVDGITKKQTTIYPYNKVARYSLEYESTEEAYSHNNGALDLWMVDGGHVRFEFADDEDMRKIRNVVAKFESEV